MPQVGYGIRCHAIIFRCPALFNFAHPPNFKCRVPKGKRPQAGWGRELELSFPGRHAAEMRPAYAISDQKGRIASVRYPTTNLKNPRYPQHGTELPPH
jgi:hypothetical protein